MDHTSKPYQQDSQNTKEGLDILGSSRTTHNSKLYLLRKLHRFTQVQSGDTVYAAPNLGIDEEGEYEHQRWLRNPHRFIQVQSGDTVYAAPNLGINEKGEYEYQIVANPSRHADTYPVQHDTSSRDLESRDQKPYSKDKGHTKLDTRDDPQHRAFSDRANPTNENELEIAKSGAELLKKLVETAPEEIQHFFTKGQTGAKIQAMFLGVKPVLFDPLHEISIDTLPDNVEEYDTIVQNDDNYRRHLSKVQLLYQQIKFHIQKTDSAKDICFLDRITRDYSKVNEVDLIEGDHAIYSYNSVKKMLNTYSHAFTSKYSSLNSFHSELMPKLMLEEETEPEERPNIELMKGLLCGYPYNAAKQFSEGNQSNRSVELHGREYNSADINEDKIAHKKDNYLFMHSGMKDFIEPYINNY